MREESLLTRRDFIRAGLSSAGGLAIGLTFPAAAAIVERPHTSGFAPWLLIDPGGSITVRVTTPEMGTGATTQLAMTVAEELQCRWSDVRIEYATLEDDARYDRVFSKSADPGYAWFSGRSTLTLRNQTLLQVGASARERLVRAAAQAWQVPAEQVSAKDGQLHDAKSGKTLSFAAVAAAAAAIEVTAEPALKPRSEWTLLGKATPTRLHVPKVTNGTAKFGIDARPPGLRYAALRQCPVQDGTLKHADFDAIRNMPGVRGLAIVEGGPPLRMTEGLAAEVSVFGDVRTSAVAVVADHYWQARKALEALPLEWNDGDGAKWTDNDTVLAAADQLIAGDGTVRLNIGDPDAAWDDAAPQVEARYTTPYCDQAPMEPLNGTCLYTPEKLALWHPAQYTDQARAAAVEESGLDPEKVHVHQMSIGGAFGRRTGADDVRMVVAVARQFPGVPIQVIWSREETFRQGRYRALMVARMRATLGMDGLPTVLRSHSTGRPLDARPPLEGWKQFTPLLGGLGDSPYMIGSIPNVRIATSDLPINVRSGAYRGPFYNANCFYVESFIDECAHAAKADPLDYRIRLLSRWPDPGWTGVLMEAAAQSGWGKPLPKGMARGIAVGNFGMFGQPQAGTTVATVATVEVSPAGELKVHRLDVVFDCGGVMNLDAVLAQMEGATIHGYNMALNEVLTIDRGRIVEGNFDRYRMVKMADIPPIHIHTGALSGHERFAELGEVAIGPVGPAIANAIFVITGKRLRSTPLRSHDLSWA